MRKVKKCCKPIPILLTIKIQKTCKDFQKALEIKKGVQQQQSNQKLQQLPKTTTRVSTITIPQEKLSCNKVGTTTVLKFRQEIIPILKRGIQNFRGINLKNHLAKWKNVTSDKIILNIIENGLKLDLIDTPKSNSKFAFPLSYEEELIVKKEVVLLKAKNIAAKATVTENNTFESGVITRSKEDGSKPMILNLKRLNKFVDYRYLKMESLQNVLELIRPGVYMASIDLKDAFYSVLVHKNHQAYLIFFVEEYLKFVCMLKWISAVCVDDSYSLLYIQRRNDRVDKEHKRLFISYRKPYHTASIESPEMI